MKKNKKGVSYVNSIYTYDDLPAYYSCSDKHPLKVSVGKHKIVVLGYTSVDLTNKKHVKALESCDVFIGLDKSWEEYEVLKKSFKNRLLQEVYSLLHGNIDNILSFHIPDGGVSENVARVIIQLLDRGLKVGFGCISAHGRTGWLLARLIKHYEGVDGDEAVRRVRKRLCENCVETDVQIDSLGCIREFPSIYPRVPSKTSYITETFFNKFKK